MEATGMEMVVFDHNQLQYSESNRELEGLNPHGDGGSHITVPLTKVTKSELLHGLNEGLLGDVLISFKLPKDCFTNILRMDDQETRVEEPMAMHTPESSQRSVYRGPITFKLPEECVDYLLKLEEEGQVTPSVDSLSLFQRIEGWTIEKRHRPGTERFDKFYYHDISKWMFGSFAEVSNFIIFGFNPHRPQKEGSLTPPQRSSLKRKRTPPPSQINRSIELNENECFPSTSTNNEEQPMTNERIVELLEEARINLLNMFNTEEKSKCGHKKEVDHRGSTR